jgi:AraC family transcriptional regulator of adaptative response / DNA-3-methyladenine glycosylase II
MRALGDPDAFLPTDLGVRRAISRLGQASGEPSVAALVEKRRPWRAYATQHLWASLDPGSVTKLANNREVAT